MNCLTIHNIARRRLVAPLRLLVMALVGVCCKLQKGDQGSTGIKMTMKVMQVFWVKRVLR